MARSTERPFFAVSIGRQHLQGGEEAKIFQIDGAQIATRTPYTFQLLGQQNAYRSQAFGSAFGMRRELLLGHLYLLVTGRQCLGSIVVQLAGQAIALHYLSSSDGAAVSWFREYYLPEYHGKVFTISKILSIVEVKGLPEEEWETGLPSDLAPYIEAQVWNHEPLAVYKGQLS